MSEEIEKLEEYYESLEDKDKAFLNLTLEDIEEIINK